MIRPRMTTIPTTMAIGSRQPVAVRAPFPRPSANRRRGGAVSSMGECYPVAGSVKPWPRLLRALAHGAHLKTGVARVEHVGVDDGPDHVGIPLLGALRVLELLLQGPRLVAGDGGAD